MALAAILGAIFGSVGTLGRQLLVNRLGRQVHRENAEQTENLTLWKELRGELTELRKEIDAVRAEVDVWKAKYWALMDEHLTLKAQYIAVQAEVTELRQYVQSKPAGN